MSHPSFKEELGAFFVLLFILCTFQNARCVKDSQGAQEVREAREAA